MGIIGRLVSMSLARSIDARVICEEDIVGSHANVEDRFRHLDMVRIMHNALGFRMSERSPSTSDGIFSEQR